MEEEQGMLFIQCMIIYESDVYCFTKQNAKEEKNRVKLFVLISEIFLRWIGH